MLHTLLVVGDAELEKGSGREPFAVVVEGSRSVVLSVEAPEGGVWETVVSRVTQHDAIKNSGYGFECDGIGLRTVCDGTD